MSKSNAEGTPTACVPCDVCGRPKAQSAGNIPGSSWCWREWMPDSDREALACYRLGYERARDAARVTLVVEDPAFRHGCPHCGFKKPETP